MRATKRVPAIRPEPVQTKAIRPAALAVLFLALGLALRLWHVTREPLWLDEAYSAFAADHDLAFLWRVVPLYETHPPFYYTLLHLWVSVLGDSLAALRGFGLLSGIATLPVMALAADAAGRWLGWDTERRRWLAVAAFGLACLSLAMVEMARQVRPYPLMVLVYAAATALLLRIARDDGRPPRWSILAYLLLLEAMLWLHNLGLLYAVTLTIALALALPWRRLRRGDLLLLAIGHFAVALAYLPGLVILHEQSTVWRHATWLRFALTPMLFDRVMTLYGVPGWVGVAALLLAAAGLGAIGRERWRLAAMLLVLALLPVMLAIVISLTITPVFVTRIMSPVAAPALLLLAIGTVGTVRRPLIGIGAAFILMASMLAGDVQTRALGAFQNWYGAIDWLAARVSPGDMIYAYPNEGALPLRRALGDRSLAIPVRAIPAEVPALEIRHGWHPTGTRGVSSLPQAELDAIAQEPATRAVPTIWLLRLGPETFDPGGGFLRALARDRRIVRHYRDGPIDIIGLSRR
ncbi:hypothetical protein [Sphingomonas nostoxanthinifaciens]|uniref:hypothetical protein n=1 Tax=Sphingomonas nostoxanthinifaciens TaxID=2872652 RepID=UPI001CC213DA|nr:hypothetical protein [Sphingomonas nostoxanthinifaciens]UAK24489.1 hypothetical protein K8P63_19655 [Sphingomonas nostoxanthinifaciens]